MAQEFVITTGVTAKAQKVVVYGPEGVGKTSFAASFPSPVFIDTEGSTSNYDLPRLPRPTSWAMLMAEVDYIKNNPLCDTLVVDTADWAERLALDAVCAHHGIKGIEDIGYGKGYVYAKEEFGRLLNKLEDLIEMGINVVITAHAYIRKFEQPDELGSYDRWELKLQKLIAPLLKEWADILIFANYKVEVLNVDNKGALKGKNKAQGGRRMMYTTHTPSWDAKNRHGLPPEAAFDYNVIAHIFNKGQPAAVESEPELPPIEVQQPQQPAPQAPPVQEQAAPPPAPPSQGVEVDPTEGIEVFAEADKPQVVQHRALNDLMLANDVRPEEIQWAVGTRGYLPGDMPVDAYPTDFIDQVLVAAWAQVCKMIMDKREEQFTNEQLPF